MYVPPSTLKCDGVRYAHKRTVDACQSAAPSPAYTVKRMAGHPIPRTDLPYLSEQYSALGSISCLPSTRQREGMLLPLGGRACGRLRRNTTCSGVGREGGPDPSVPERSARLQAWRTTKPRCRSQHKDWVRALKFRKRHCTAEPGTGSTCARVRLRSPVRPHPRVVDGVQLHLRQVQQLPHLRHLHHLVVRGAADLQQPGGSRGRKR